MSATTVPILDLASKWLSLDKDPKTKAQIQALVDANDTNTLEALLRHPIEFGTAGLRARMEAGFSRMNCVTVIQASQGLAIYVKNTVPNATERGVVIGYDHRHNSETFARLTAAVFLDQGYKVYFLKGLSCTPLVPFSVKKLATSCGVMITASHNPKNDNGYKVYWENGAQIIPPHDAGIAKCIADNQEIALWDDALVDSHQNSIFIKDSLMDQYFEIAKNSYLGDSVLNSDLKYVYTAMHGVGAPFCKRILDTFNLHPFIPVVEQIDPDPDFPTVSFPNPEEKGALDLAKSVADQNGATLVLASDPDADRFAAAEKQPDGSWFVFSGDQLGSILAYFTFLLAKSKNIPVEKIAMVNSTVSSRMLEAMAKVEGFCYRDTLTGFKWMSNELVNLRDNHGYIPTFAYEEAIGYLINPEVLDKDGVSALVGFVQLAAHISKDGQSVKQLLDSLYSKYGYFASNNYYYICYDIPKINSIFDKIRFGSADQQDHGLQRTNIFCSDTNSTLRYPSTLGGSKVTYIRDLTIGFESDSIASLHANNSSVNIKFADYAPKFMVSPESQMITFETENGGRVTLRTSGTEPKIKYYIEMRGDNSNREKVAADLHALSMSVENDLMDAKTNGLI